MNTQKYLIDTNIIIHLEDNKNIEPVFSDFLRLSSKHKVDVFVHEASSDDLARDKDFKRQAISASKILKFQLLKKVHGLTDNDLSELFGELKNPNDIVDATLLHTLNNGVVDFLVSQDKGIHTRAKKYSSDLGHRVLFIDDALQLLKTTYEPVEDQVRSIEEVLADEINLKDNIFKSLKEDYPNFDIWWKEKCLKQRRSCWIVRDDDGIAGILVRKDETGEKTDATEKRIEYLKSVLSKFVQICEDLSLVSFFLRKFFWFAQKNKYNLIYITTYDRQAQLIELLEYFGFKWTSSRNDGERIYEKTISACALVLENGEHLFGAHRQNYPRLAVNQDTESFIIPIQESYHDVLYPGLKAQAQLELFGSRKSRPGNTIRKVYLCRSPSGLRKPGSILFFYKGKSRSSPSQVISVIGILEDVNLTPFLKRTHPNGRWEVCIQ